MRQRDAKVVHERVAPNLWFIDACGGVYRDRSPPNPVLDLYRPVTRFGSNHGISIEYIGPEVLAQQAVSFGVLAQVTKPEPAFLKR